MSRAGVTGVRVSETIQEIRVQLETIRTASSTSCSDQIKRLEINLQKVQRTKKSTDKVLRYVSRIFLGMPSRQTTELNLQFIVGILLLYLILYSRVVQVSGMEVPNAVFIY